MEILYRAERALTKLLEALVTLCFFFILSVTIVLVIMRYGFNTAIIGGNEAMNYLFIYTTSLGAAVSIGNGEHIKITYFTDKLSPRVQGAIRIIDYLLIAFINGIMIWYSLPWINSTGNFESPVLRIPNWMVQISVPVGCGLVVLYCLSHIFLEVFNPNPPAVRGRL